MSLELWIGIGVIFIVCWGFIIWELITGPVYSDNYTIVEEEAEKRDAPPTNEKSPPKSQTYSDDRVYKHWQYPTTDCLCQMGKPVENHTPDCQERWENHGKYYHISELRKELEMWKNYSDISFDLAAQKEYLRIEKEIERLKKK